MKTNFVDPEAPSTTVLATATSGTTVTVTIAADPLNFWVLRRLIFSYSTLGSIGRLTIAIGGTNVLDVDITLLEQKMWAPPKGWYANNMPKNEAMVVTLYGVTSAIGKLNVTYA